MTFARALNLRYHLWFGRDMWGKVASIRVPLGPAVRAAVTGEPIQWADGYASGPMVVRSVVTPLIRHEIGDWAQVGAPCSCGRGLPVVRRVLGRTRNMLVLRTGEKIYPPFRFEDFASDFGIRQFQVIQRDLDKLVVRLAPKTALGPAGEETIRRSLREAAAYDFAIVFEYLEEIPRGASGKYEVFRSDVTAA